jgi:hypothetical protein
MFQKVEFFITYAKRWKYPVGLQLLVFVLSFFSLPAAEFKGIIPLPANQLSNKTLTGGCAPSTGQADLDLNNVRAKILGGGDMWWDPGATTAKYEVPKGSGKHSMFTGALWVGGIDAGGTLKVAAMTYRQTGNDFFPGPLSSASVSISAKECSDYDAHWKITRQEVEAFATSDFQNPSPAIASWPGNNTSGEYLAPFYDANSNGIYEPLKGDYPYYKISNQNPQIQVQGPCSTCTGNLYGDQSVWWVFNDVGNIHTQTGAQAIGLEVQAQGFAFTTNDEINNMTFYQYKVINRSSFQLNNTYIGQWADPDLGNANDDFVGCDVARGLGYCYNGLSDDSGPNGYGLNPPAIGIDFFQGPLADSNDGIDNNRDGVIDEPCEQIIMSQFVYYNNDISVRGEPFTGTDHYNYLKGIWKDGTSMTYGGTGYNTGSPCSFMFPDNTDATHPVSWTEDNSGNSPGDRRFLQSAGKFTLGPGAVNYITVGVVWARASQGGRLASIPLLKAADDKAQSLFNNCFKVLDGPDAPDMTIRELDNQLILSLDNDDLSNNYNEGYNELDPTIVKSKNNKYVFQGYQIFQLKDNTVTVADVHNPDKARLVAQCDVQDDVAQLINFYYDPNLNANIPVEEVNGANKGISHTFLVKQDLFATGSPALINHKPYYFTVLAYAYNRYAPFNPSNPDTLIYGQKKPYFAGRKNLKTYSGIPHNPGPDNNGQLLLAKFGSGPKITRLAGSGNGGLVLDLTAATIQEIISGTAYQALNPVYDNGRSPLNIQVYDPVKVPQGDFRFSIDSLTIKGAAARWKLTNLTSNETVYSTQTITVNNEQIISKWGLSVRVVQAKNPGADMLHGNGFLEATQTFADSSHAWLTGLKDEEGDSPLNWIRAGKYASSSDTGTHNDYDYTIDKATGKVYGSGIDDNQDFEKCIGGTWAPYRLCSKYPNGPAKQNVNATSLLADLASVDVVITPDKSKWSRCPVLEMNENPSLTEGGASKFSLRRHASVNKEGQPDGSKSIGMSWFPGYAINIETGERLNIMFGEDSWLKTENGSDMLWNPTSSVLSPFGMALFGGKHYIYILANKNTSRYDEGQFIASNLAAGFSSQIFSSILWVSIPLLAKNETLLSNEVKIRLRVTKPYVPYLSSLSPIINPNPAYGFNTSDLMASKNNAAAAQKALESINVVPNPYYAYSTYESNQLDHKVKITNLPTKCTISIYTVGGTLVRKFVRDISKNSETSLGGPVGAEHPESALEWDLKNSKGVPVASGMYIIHIDAGTTGERILKWLGVMRPIDLDTF